MELFSVANLATFANIQWVKPLWKQLRAIRGQRAKDVLALQDRFGHFNLLVQYYVPPKCQHHNPADYHEDQLSRAFLRMPLHEALQDFLGGKTLRLGDGSNQLFILADAGMGKTSALLMLKLWHLFGFWPKAYDCLLLKLGEDSLKRIAQQDNKANTVLLLDALDEDPKVRGRIAERLRELLAASQHFRQVILTCRTQFFPPTGLSPFGEPGRVTVGGYCCPMLFLSLFDDGQVDDYLAKRFPRRWRYLFNRCTDPRRAKAKALLRSSMHSLRFRPLLLSYIDDLLQAQGRLDDAYQVFQALVTAWLVREIGKMAQNIQPVPSVAELWAACRLFAVYLQCLNRRELSEAELDGLMQRLPAIAELERLDFGGRSLLNRNSKSDYRFAHYSIQEFLVAHALREGGLQEDLDLCPEPALGQRPRVTEQMLLFVDNAALRQHGALLDWQDWTLEAAWHKLATGEIQAEMLRGVGLRSALKDGGLGPEMVIIPAGRFWMGAKPGEQGALDDEYPRHSVTIAKPFALGRYPVTFSEYERFCVATGRDRPSDNGWGRVNRPVINVSWHDAQAYCVWLSEQTGADYRLPSEAEWEYAARAGSETAYWWGDKFVKGLVNFRDPVSPWLGRKTSPVDALSANSWGLHDMSGNVWEWVHDEYRGNYHGAPADGTALEFNNNSRKGRVLRGGSWNSEPFLMRSASRYRTTPTYRGTSLGFRLAQD